MASREEGLALITCPYLDVTILNIKGLDCKSVVKCFFFFFFNLNRWFKYVKKII
jgi:hypothetical protein